MSAIYAIFFPILFAAVFLDDVSATPARGERERYFRMCDDAARTASYESSVPFDVLKAITRTETGRTTDGSLQPWPWTVNMEGRGVWFDDRAEALMFVFDHFKTGARSFDVGCFQINYRWHGAQFSSIEEMFDPLANARYAASFLKSLYQESGDWNVAVGAFHSRTQTHADRYMVRFGTIFNEIDPIDDPRAEVMANAMPQRRTNRFPLLQQGLGNGLGSLVPLQNEDSLKPVIDLISRSGN